MTAPLTARAEGRCAVVATLAITMQAWYRDAATTEDQRSHIETIVGAALWYVSAGLKSGWMSEAALRALHPDAEGTRLSEDHAFPRKRAARELLTLDWTAVPDPPAFVSEAYATRYGVVHLVTPEENKRLVAYQKHGSFQGSEASYAAAGIRLVWVGPDMKPVRRRDRATIERLLS